MRRGTGAVGVRVALRDVNSVFELHDDSEETRGTIPVVSVAVSIVVFGRTGVDSKGRSFVG